MPIRPIGPAIRTGMRQPHSIIPSWPRKVSPSSTIREPSAKPPMVPNSRKLPRNPRLRSGADSAMKVAAPPYSPPVEKPGTARRTISRIGARTVPYSPGKKLWVMQPTETA